MKQRDILELMRYTIDFSKITTSIQEKIVNAMILNADGTYSIGDFSSISFGTRGELRNPMKGFRNNITRGLKTGLFTLDTKNFKREGVYLIKLRDMVRDTYKIGFGKDICKRLESQQGSLPSFDYVEVYSKPQFLAKGIFDMSAGHVEGMFKNEFRECNAKKDIYDASEFYHFTKYELKKVMSLLDDLMLRWAMSYNKLTIMRNNNGAERYRPVTINEATKAIKNCKLLQFT